MTAGIPVHYAVATSLLSIIITSASAASIHGMLGQVSLPFLGSYGIGAVIGAAVGAWIAPRICDNHIRNFIGILLLFIALLMIKEKILV